MPRARSDTFNTKHLEGPPACPLTGPGPRGVSAGPLIGLCIVTDGPEPEPSANPDLQKNQRHDSVKPDSPDLPLCMRPRLERISLPTSSLKPHTWTQNVKLPDLPPDLLPGRLPALLPYLFPGYEYS